MLFYKREIGLYFIVALIPMQVLIEKIQVFPLGKDIVDIYLVTLLLLCLLRPEKQEERDLNFLIPMKPILFYMFLTYVFLWIGSFINGLDLPISGEDVRFINWKNHMILPVLFIVTFKIIYNKRQMINLISVIIISMFLVSFHFYRNFGHTGGHFREERRWSGVFTYLGPNEIGAFWAEYSFIILGLLLISKVGPWKWPLIGVLGLNIYCMVYSFSRGAYLAFGIAFLFISVATRNIKAIVFVSLMAIILTYLIPQSAIERVNMTQDEEVGLESSAAGRLGRWKHGVDLFIKNPLGYGYETVAVLGFRGNRGYLSSKGDPHNRYVEFLVEMGIIGIALFLYLFYLAFKGGWKLYLMAEDNFLKGLGLGFSATVVACFIVNIFGDRWTYAMLGAFYWVVWALVVRGNIIANKKQSMVELNSTATV
jgi:O-antigen ligase